MPRADGVVRLAGVSGVTSHPRAVWWKRWPVWAGAAAIFLLGLSAGMLLERTRHSESDAAREVATSSASGALGSTPTPGPNREVVPNPNAKSMDTIPKRPKRLAPPGPRNQPRNHKPNGRSVPPSSRRPLASTQPVAAFMDELVDVACDKLIKCGGVPIQTKSVCSSLFDDYRDPDADDKVIAGVCAFDASAADRCIDAITRIECSRVSLDPASLTGLLAGPLLTCQQSLRCN